MSAFHAYDIRGIYPQDFNKDDVYRIGFFLPEVLNASRILVGRDIRNSSPEIFDYLSRGIADAGADVYDAGLTTTPMIYWSTAHYGYEGSVMITASHNPKEYNGLKVSARDALPVGYENGLKEVEFRMSSPKRIVPKTPGGKIHKTDVRDDYIAFLRSYPHQFDNLNVAVDCSNGMAGIVLEDVLGTGLHVLNKTPDGHFPGHDPNPLNPSNIRQIQGAVLNEKMDVGVIFDGDADRVMFVDETGSFVPPDLIIAVLGHHFLEGNPTNTRVLQDIRTSNSVKHYLHQFGADVRTWKVGRAHAALKLREIDGIYGGEFAGHYYFRDFYYSDSGMLACLLTLNILSKFKKEGVCVSELINKIRLYENSGELNFPIREKEAAMEAVKSHFSNNERITSFFDFDGYRLEFKDWWFNIRPSNTEPYLRLLVEANTTGLLVDKVGEIEKIIKQFE